MDKKKIIIISSILVVIISIIIIIAFNNSNEYKKTVFLGSSTRIKIDNNKMILSNDDIEVPKQKAKIINDNKTIDGYILTEDEEGDISMVINNCHAYTEDGESVLFDTALIAYTTDLDIKYIPINNDYINDIDVLEDYFEENDIDTSDIYLDYLKESYFDYDKDSNYEYIYSLGYTNDDGDSISMVIMEKDGEYYLISSENNSEEENTTLEFLNILDFNNSNNYYFIIKKLKSNYSLESYDLYTFDGNKFNKANHNE